MDATSIFALQSTLTLITYAVIAWWYAAPRLARLERRAALIAVLWIHTLRTLGLTLLVPGVTDANLPRDFAVPLAAGDLATAVLAFAAIAALRRRWPLAVALVWLTTLVGVGDLLNVTYEGIAVRAATYALGASWLIPTYFVPALWVAHGLAVWLLLRRAPAKAAA